jgi:hypothetical protein
MRAIVTVVGVIFVLVGLVWTLQGIGVLQGSVMSGSMLWAVIGPIVAIVGLILLFGFGMRRRKA